MVVVSGSWMKNVATYPTPTVEADIVNLNDKENMAAKAVLICRPNSHHFQERTLILDQAVKVGRSVARAKPTAYNAIFDCKVLSRHHALLWYENGKFFLQDTKSSNGTFVNNNRLTNDNHEVCSGDIVQFGVDVVENNRKVTHGCIIATLKLYLPDGKEAKASPSITEGEKHGVVPLDDLYALNQILQDANQREQCLESKLTALQHVVEETRKSAEESWQAYVGEERLLSRLSALETQLQQNSKNWSEDRIREEIAKLRETNEQYQEAAKAALEKVHEEKLEAVSLAMEQERGRISAEQDALLSKEQLAQAQLELQEVAQKLTEMHQKFEDTSIQHEKYVQELELKLDEEENKVIKLQAKVQELTIEMQEKLKFGVPWEQIPDLFSQSPKSKEEIIAENEILSETVLNKSNNAEQNHISLTVGPVDEKNETEKQLDDSEVTSKDDDEDLSEYDFTEKEERRVSFKLPEVTNDEDHFESQNDSQAHEDDENNAPNHTTEKEEIDSKTLKYQFQSAQNELKRKIEHLETAMNTNKNKISDLERELSDEKELSSARAMENDNLKHELTLTRQKLKEHCNENTQLKDRIAALTNELEQSKKVVVQSVADNKVVDQSEDTNKAMDQRDASNKVVDQNEDINKTVDQNGTNNNALTQSEASKKALTQSEALEPNNSLNDSLQDQKTQQQVNISQSLVTYEQLVNVEEELVMLKERFALNTEDKMKLQKELVKMTEQYHDMCNNMHNRHFFYIAPLVLMVLYLLVSAMIS